MLARTLRVARSAAMRSCSRAARPKGLFGGLWELPQVERGSHARSAFTIDRDAGRVPRPDAVAPAAPHRCVPWRDAGAACRARHDPGYDAIARVRIADAAQPRHRRGDHRDPDEVPGHTMELDPKALALFTEGYDKILEGIGQLGYDVSGRELRRHRQARGEGAPRAHPRPEAGQAGGRARCSRRRSRRSTPRW